jgi:hypothetical protein
MRCDVTNSREWDGEVGDVEELIRSAGNYVQVSTDLRPRVLEAARLRGGERRARSVVRKAALVAALLMWCVTASIRSLDMPDNLRELTIVAAGAYPASASHASGGNNDVGWSLVDAFTELRCRQADVLRPKL